jgi:hypothetical protein
MASDMGVWKPSKFTMAKEGLSSRESYSRRRRRFL